MENYKSAEFISEDSLLHIEDLPCKIAQVNFPEKGDNEISFVHLYGDRLYLGSGETLYIYSVTDYTSPIARYPIKGYCHSGLVADNLLFLGGSNDLRVFKLTNSLITPLILIRKV